MPMIENSDSSNTPSSLPLPSQLPAKNNAANWSQDAAMAILNNLNIDYWTEYSISRPSKTSDQFYRSFIREVELRTVEDWQGVAEQVPSLNARVDITLKQIYFSIASVNKNLNARKTRNEDEAKRLEESKTYFHERMDPLSKAIKKRLEKSKTEFHERMDPPIKAIEKIPPLQKKPKPPPISLS